MPMKASDRTLRMPLAERRAILSVEVQGSARGTIESRRLVDGHVHSMVVALAEALNAELARWRHLGAAVPPGEVFDAMDPAYLHADAPDPPVAGVYQLHAQPDGILITSRAAVGSVLGWLRYPYFRIGLWQISLPLLAGWLLPMTPLPFPPGLMEATALMSLMGVFLLMGAVWIGRLHYSYQVTADSLLRIAHILGLSWKRTYPRSQIAAVRVAFRSADENQVKAVLEIVQVDGKTRDFTSGRVESLRFLGTHLRRGLGVPVASAAAEGLNPDLAAYHDLDEPTVPAVFEVTQTAEATIIVRPRSGFTSGSWMVFGVALFFLMGSILLPTLALAHADPKDRDAIFGLTGVAFVGAVLLILVTIIEGTERFVFVAGSGALTFTRQDRFFRKERTFVVADLAAIRSDVKGHQSYSLVLITHDGKRINLIANSHPERARFVATQLRRILGLPAKLPPG